MKRKLYLLILWAAAALPTWAQETFPLNGPKDERAGAYAFTNATIVVDEQTTLEGATLLIRDGRIENAGKGIAVPKGYTVMDLSGKYLYPGLIDLYTNYGQPEVKVERGGGFGGAREVLEPTTEGPYNANEAIKSYYDGASEFKPDAKSADEWRKLGFGAVLSYRPDGVARGTAIVATPGEDRANEVILRDRAAALFSFNKGTSKMNYPVSAMGYISLLRQTYLDANWYDQYKNSRPFTDKGLEAMIANRNLPQIFEAANWLSLTRADRIGDEFGVQYIIKGSGDEYQRIDLIKATKAPLIIPVNFPDAMDVEDPIDAYRVALADLKHWELAPTNPAALEKAGIEFVFTADGLKDKKQLLANIRKAIQHGLSEKTALRALTSGAAKFIGMSNDLGSLKKGAVANFLVTSGPLFGEETVVFQNWVQGKKYQLEDMNPLDAAGKYALALNGQNHVLEISGKPGKQTARIVTSDTSEIKVSMKASGETITLGFAPDPKQKDYSVALTGWKTGSNLRGAGQASDGRWIEWTATRQGDVDSKDKSDKKADANQMPAAAVTFPFGAYGRTALPQVQTMLIKNATVWTMENEGVLEGTDVLVQNGKIARIGKNLSAAGATVVDGTGMHLTPGIIDEHSHIGATSINDVLANSSMVRIGDNIDPEDPDIYRALSGGVTSIQILHGSANPIGGQSALIKLRWGKGPEELKIEGADPFIKFALGENVKRSRSPQSIRYPQSRMGVEQIFVDAFTAARDYEKSWKTYNALSSTEKSKTMSPRRDLAMDAMVEILNKQRFISCHSYVQSEINMLMKVAEQFGFRINTFTHILEGYKVADKMAAHGVGGAGFSDWWSYKWEVRYAIPYNAAIMHRAGVVSAINSDDAEMMRRLNQEAAKCVKYGGLSEVEALSLIPINPAKLLHLDQHTGSLKIGKDADLVLWTDHPLSIYARAAKTIVDGAVYYDMEEDQQLKASVEAERARLLAKMRAAKAGGGATRPAAARGRREFHCDDVFLYNE